MPSPERDFELKPYTEDETRVARYLVELTDGMVGGGDDPIGFLIASHGVLSSRVVAFTNCEPHKQETL